MVVKIAFRSRTGGSTVSRTSGQRYAQIPKGGFELTFDLTSLSNVDDYAFYIGGTEVFRPAN